MIGKLTLLVILFLLYLNTLNSQDLGTSSTSNHSIVKRYDGKVYTWGWNDFGQLGNGQNTQRNIPVAVNTSGLLNDKVIIQVAAGAAHSLALSSDGIVYSWGANLYGALGNGNNISINMPGAVYISGALNGKIITKVAAGSGHSLVTASDGTVFSWGQNTYGQLGDGTSGNGTDKNVPVEVSTSGVLNGKIITQVAAGTYHSIALASDGTVYTWGNNSFGQLGDGSNTQSSIPVAVNTSGVLSGKTVIQVAAGYTYNLVLASDGTIYAWGRNDYGQLGNGNTGTNRNVPVAILTNGALNGKTIIQIAAGAFHGLALASDGTVYTWGLNDYGQLGNGNTGTNSNIPVAVSTGGVLNGKTIIQIATGFDHCLALASDGTLYSWGNNTYGELGNGNNTSSNVPVQVDQSGLGLLPVDEPSSLLLGYELLQNYPNPFNPNTIISWQSAVGSHQTLKVYDVLGNEVATLVDEYKPAGSYEVEFRSADGIRQLASGIYFFQLRITDPEPSSRNTQAEQSFIETKKMILLK